MDTSNAKMVVGLLQAFEIQKKYKTHLKKALWIHHKLQMKMKLHFFDDFELLTCFQRMIRNSVCRILVDFFIAGCSLSLHRISSKNTCCNKFRLKVSFEISITCSVSFAGQKFALYQIKLGIVNIIRHYSIKVNNKTVQPIIASPLDSLLTPISDIYLDFHQLWTGLFRIFNELYKTIHQK